MVKKKQDKETDEHKNQDDKESVLSDYTNMELDKGTKDRITIEPIPEDQRDREKERIFGGKIDIIIDDFKKLKYNAVEKGFLSKDKADETIRAADSGHPCRPILVFYEMKYRIPDQKLGD